MHKHTHAYTHTHTHTHTHTLTRTFHNPTFDSHLSISFPVTESRAVSASGAGGAAPQPDAGRHQEHLHGPQQGQEQGEAAGKGQAFVCSFLSGQPGFFVMEGCQGRALLFFAGRSACVVDICVSSMLPVYFEKSGGKYQEKLSKDGL